MKIIVSLFACMGSIVLNNAMQDAGRVHLPAVITFSSNIRIAVKIHGAKHIEAGHIRMRAGEPMEWLYNPANAPAVPERVYVKLRSPPGQHLISDHDFVGNLVTLDHHPTVAFYERSEILKESKCFIKDDQNIYHATLKTGEIDSNPSSGGSIEIRVRNPQSLYQYIKYCGILEPWTGTNNLPVWAQHNINSG